MIKKDGTEIWVQLQIISVHDKSGILYSQINCENISQSRQIEEELNKFNQQIESKVTEKTLQLSNINYQLSKEIEERKRVQDQIKNSLEEKEILLREIHHRVKNNLQIISSLLSLQSSNLNNDLISKKFKKSQNRIFSMALIHEHLYESENLNKIVFSEYIRKLANTIFETYDKSHSDINLFIDIKNVFLAIDIAIPCGLIVNELLSNSLEHAFIDKASKKSNNLIDIQMYEDLSNNCYILEYSDN